MDTDIPGMNNTLRERCISLWTILNEQSNHIDGVGNQGRGDKFWTGKISEIYVTAGIPLGSSKTIVKHLIELGSLTYVQRGNSVQPTVLRIGVDPATIEWVAPDRNSGESDLTPLLSPAMLSQTVQDIKKRLGGINLAKAFEAINQQIAEQDDKIENLTKRLDELNGEKQAGQG